MVITGLHRLVEEKGAMLRGRRVGLVTHAAAVTPDLQAALDVLIEAGVVLRALFAPEHGLESAAADADPIAHGVHPRFGIPVYSLYGETHSPTPAMLADLDVLVFDMQDVGVRFYTYVSTLFHVLRAAGQFGLPVVVLDRPNPINGLAVEGPLLEPEFASFIGVAPLPVRHGMTMGELARWLNAAYNLQADLSVIPMAGWQRAMWFDETGLPWVPTSPAMPHFITTLVYPGMCLIEGTNLSEGRGTALPFEVAGAPWLDAHRLAQSLNALDLPGVRFRPTHFIPSAGKHTGQPCQGVQVHVLARNVFQPVRMGVHLVAACRAAAPDRFAFLAASWEGRAPHFDLLMGNAAVRMGIEAGLPVEELIADWQASEADFCRRRAPYLLYE
ncbi:MAG: exo-beta-N-acetylmuramidase NamZ domain-containing protein [Candidatus Brachytrichaceae bacterium NZ_4S206]|jgi:uncharacterized protein YbbC (DUF1343 family)